MYKTVDFKDHRGAEPIEQEHWQPIFPNGPRPERDSYVLVTMKGLWRAQRAKYEPVFIRPESADIEDVWTIDGNTVDEPLAYLPDPQVYYPPRAPIEIGQLRQAQDAVVLVTGKAEMPRGWWIVKVILSESQSISSSFSGEDILDWPVVEKIT